MIPAGWSECQVAGFVGRADENSRPWNRRWESARLWRLSPGLHVVTYSPRPGPPRTDRTAEAIGTKQAYEAGYRWSLAAAELGEVTIMTVWPSVGGTPLGRTLGRLFLIQAGFWHIFTSGNYWPCAAIPSRPRWCS